MRGVKTLAKGMFVLAVVIGAVMSTSSRAAASATELIALTNQYRNQNGLDSLQVSNQLMQSAHEKAQHMLENNYWAHDAPDGTDPWHFINSTDYSYKVAGENLAKDFKTDAGVLRGLMNSELHKKNILDTEFTEVGVAEIEGTLEGKKTTLIVFHYAAPKTPNRLAEKEGSSANLITVVADALRSMASSLAYMRAS